MTDFFDGVRMGSFDTEYDDDTIEMVLTESAMHLLSQAAAQTESGEPVVSPAAKEPEVRGVAKVQGGAEAGVTAKVLAVAEMQGAAKVRPTADANAIAKAQSIGETRASQQPQPASKALVTPEVQPVAAARAAPEPRPDVKVPADTEEPAAVARQRPIAKDQVPQGYRPPMSTLRFALILSLVAVGSALLTAGTYFFTMRASPPVKVVTIRVPATPAPAVVATPSPAAAIAATTEPATAPAPRPPGVAATEPASRPPGLAAIAPMTSPSATAAPGAAVTALTPTPVSGPSTDQPATVRFVNPFDKREVFEFPPGTSQADARDAVADLLADRARDRRGLLVKTPRRNGKTADSGAPVIASGIAPRS